MPRIIADYYTFSSNIKVGLKLRQILIKRRVKISQIIEVIEADEYFIKCKMTEQKFDNIMRLSTPTFDFNGGKESIPELCFNISKTKYTFANRT